MEIETSPGVYSTPEEDSYSIDFAIDTINCDYPSCTGMYLDVAGHMLAFYDLWSMIKVSQPVKPSLTFPPGWGTLLGGDCDV